MLREILLSLSGLPSPIWDDLSSENGTNGQESALGQYTSPAERQMLQSLAELARLHIKLREETRAIAASHPSPACRAVSSRIASFHLRAFTDKIIDVEASILRDDSKFVGAYKIVPLSTLVTEFQPWIKPLRWLAEAMQVMQSTGSQQYTSAKLFEYLEKECQTGYLDIMEIATDLMVAGQKAWFQSLVPWLLYGQLPIFGTTDFMIQASKDNIELDFVLQSHLRPFFVPIDTAQTMLAVGRALQQLKSTYTASTRTSQVSCNSLMPQALQHIKSLRFPLQANDLGSVVNNINEAISQTALSRLVSMGMILELLQVIQDYVLLGDGEFASYLINHAENRIRVGQTLGSNDRLARKLGKLDMLDISVGELPQVLSRTWTDLAAVSRTQIPSNDVQSQAGRWLRLRPVTHTLPINTFLPVQAGLMLEFSTESPLWMFLTIADQQRYCQLNAYLISLRRAVTKLASLWDMSSHRRIQRSRGVDKRASTRRARDRSRDIYMRLHWACASLVLYLLSEITSYLHGEVIEKSWSHLENWLLVHSPSRPSSSYTMSRPATASVDDSIGSFARNTSTPIPRTDPRVIAVAHHDYLVALYRDVLLNNEEYILVLRELLNTVDHYVALFQRLAIIWQELDLLNDDHIPSTNTKFRQEEQEIKIEMSRTNNILKEQVDELVITIRDAEYHVEVTDVSADFAGVNIRADADMKFEPRKTRPLERLLMKLDSLGTSSAEEQFEDALVDAQDDE